MYSPGYSGYDQLSSTFVPVALPTSLLLLTLKRKLKRQVDIEKDLKMCPQNWFLEVPG